MMTPVTTTTIQFCPRGCPGIWSGFAFCPTCGGALETVAVTMQPIREASLISKVLFDGGADALQKKG